MQNAKYDRSPKANEMKWAQQQLAFSTNQKMRCTDTDLFTSIVGSIDRRAGSCLAIAVVCHCHFAIGFFVCDSVTSLNQPGCPLRALPLPLPVETHDT